MKKVSFGLSIIVITLFPIFSFAEGQAEKGIADSVYLFHLYYDSGQLFADRDFEFKYDILTEKFVPEILNTTFPYKGEVVRVNGQVAVTFKFNPRQGQANFIKGKISVKAPYFADAQKVSFYDSQGNPLVSISVIDSSFCNDDGICNDNVGENDKTCPNDCKNVPVTPIPTGNFPSPVSGKSGLTSGIVYVLIGLGVLGSLWYWRKKKNSKTLELPSNLPPSNLK